MTTTGTVLRSTRRNALRAGVALTLGLSATYAAGVAPAGAATGDSVWTAGLNGDGQLGNGTLTNRPRFESVAGMADVDSIAGGRQHVLALRDGRVWAWGDGPKGALGLGSFSDVKEPTQVPGLSGVSAITSGHYGSYARMSDGTVRSWGLNANGQLGNGDVTKANKNTPQVVKGLTGVKQVAAGRDFAMALLTSGTVRAWGMGSNGELGNGQTPAAQLTPVTVTKSDGTTLTGVSEIAAGRNTGLALVSGNVWAWGENARGEVGNGTTVDQTRAVKVSGLSGVVDIEAGAEFSVAVKSDGTVWTWGFNNNGQLGNGGTASRSTPAQVPGLSGVAGVGCGRDHVIAWKMVTGDAWGWGLNTYGQLGLTTATSKQVKPIRITGITKVKRAHAGFGYSVLQRSA